MKYLCISYAILQKIFFKTIVFYKKKIYFCCKYLVQMIQRIQTLYLALVLINSSLLPWFVYLWKTSTQFIFAFSKPLFIGMFLTAALLSLISIFSFKNRKNQFVFNRLNMILNFILIGLFIYNSLNLSGESSISEKGIGMFLPIFSIVFLAFANKAIKKDEDLVKSVDRIR